METHPTVVILKADQLYAATLRAHVEAVLPGARITVAPDVAAARTLLERAPVDLLLGSLGEGPEGDALDLLAQSTRAPRRARRVLVVALRCTYRTLSALRTLAVEGVFDAVTEEPGAFRPVLERVLAGQRSWSPSVQGQLRQISAAPTALFRLLTDFEQLVLGGGTAAAESGDHLLGAAGPAPEAGGAAPWRLDPDGGAEGVRAVHAGRGGAAGVRAIRGRLPPAAAAAGDGRASGGLSPAAAGRRWGR
jgi:DNA-binding NarL/FixJ family response regulator